MLTSATTRVCATFACPIIPLPLRLRLMLPMPRLRTWTIHSGKAVMSNQQHTLNTFSVLTASNLEDREYAPRDRSRSPERDRDGDVRVRDEPPSR